MSATRKSLASKVVWSSNGPGEKRATFKIGVSSLPYLADHGFQGMTVMPGSFFVEMALCLDHELTGRVPQVLRNLTFRTPVILSREDTAISVVLRTLPDACIEYIFREGSGDTASRDEPPYSATLEIDRTASASSDRPHDAFSIEAFQARSTLVIAAAHFYKRLRENGNEYGPRFQNDSAIWRSGDEALARISLSEEARLEAHRVHPCLLDAATQLLAPFVMSSGRTFVLRGIERIEIVDGLRCEPSWGHARLLPGDDAGPGARGHVVVFDDRSIPCMKLSGVELTLLGDVDDSADEQTGRLVVAANFTADPLQDSLSFWAGHFGVPLQVEFAPYNQVFQQLLDRGSSFHTNSAGLNVIALALEAWADSARAPALAVDRHKVKEALGSRERCVLPNGLEIAHLNRYETDYVYKEIFVDRCYLRHGLVLRDADTIIDIGANIGLFSLFVMTSCKAPRIYAFEPAPLVYDLLRANCDAYGSGNARVFDAGVSDKAGTATFTFYQKSSVFSGFHSDEGEDRQAIQAVVRDMLSAGAVAGDTIEQYIDELTADRLRRQTSECRLTTVSDIIRDNRIERVDFLKIDAEKSELAILRGIADHDWPKIAQLVIEIHDRSREKVRQVEDLLRERGYRCVVDQESLLEHAGFFNLYATRSTLVEDDRAQRPLITVEEGIAGDTHRIDALTRNVDDLAAALQSFTSASSVPLVVCLCPATPAVKTRSRIAAALDHAEQTLLAAVRSLPNVHAISSGAALQRYPVDDYYDSEGDRLGHVVYTPRGFAAIGTALTRTIFNAGRAPYKVIVLDCDNTLWKGVCGEDGPLGVEIQASHRALQAFMIEQMKAGMLLCLCSRNSENDVLSVFDQRTDMLLRREHLVSWRINWNSKSQNVRALAKELDLGLDAFIFIDDNPVECADVRIHCPGILALQLPGNPPLVPSFLEHVWAFDASASTGEDERRTRMYQQGAQRQRYREQAMSLSDFIKGLELRIDIAEAVDEQAGRISQLTLRTNQFNFSTLRRSEGEVREFMRGPDAHCLAVRVVDRFGDYGLVGAVMYEVQDDRCRVDTFVLSCRVLGRGVEHAIVARLGQRAIDQRKQVVEFVYRQTERNAPVLAFTASIGGNLLDSSSTSWTCESERLAKVRYDPDMASPLAQDTPTSLETPARPRRPSWTFDAAERSDRLQRIAEDFNDVERILFAIDERRRSAQPARPPAADASSGTAAELKLATIWATVLARPRIGRNENFFDAGGTSLRAVQVMAMIKKEFDRSLSLVTLFERPTIALLAQSLDAASGEPESARAESATQRGQQRRYNTTRRRAP